LRTKRGNDREAKEALRVGLTELLDQAGKHSVTGLLLPTLTVAPEDENTPSVDDFFYFLFDSLQVSRTPALIDLSFFSGWPTGDLEEATGHLHLPRFPRRLRRYRRREDMREIAGWRRSRCAVVRRASGGASRA
jgi:hypothetical protein